MKTRREILKLAAAASLVAPTLGCSSASTGKTEPGGAASAEGDDRARWCRLASRLAHPVLGALAERRLKASMPVELAPGGKDRSDYTHLEALGRLLCGLAPWLELGADESAEGRERARLAVWAREGIDAGTDPRSPDFMNFTRGAQPLVDAAFLAQAIRRAPTELWAKLDRRVQTNVIAALKATRSIQPFETNWKLFATTIEIFLQCVGEPRDEARLFEGIRKHRHWYLGDGVYGDGPEFHWDYYNSFVIQPMLVEALDVVGSEAPECMIQRQNAHAALARWAAIQERLIAPDGTYPVIGRSVAYRCGAFQGLALAAVRRMLPHGLAPAQARRALTAVIQRTLEVPGTFDAAGWLQIGVSGHQPAIGEGYISTGSLYLCSAAFLPLGLPAEEPFWSAPAEPTTGEKIWSGKNVTVDHALELHPEAGVLAHGTHR